jgi:hypothetical protein
VPATVFGHQRQPGQRPHRPIRAQHRIGQLEQRVRPPVQALVEVVPNPSNSIVGVVAAPVEGVSGSNRPPT